MKTWEERLREMHPDNLRLMIESERQAIAQQQRDLATMERILAEREAVDSRPTATPPATDGGQNEGTTRGWVKE